MSKRQPVTGDVVDEKALVLAGGALSLDAPIAELARDHPWILQFLGGKNFVEELLTPTPKAKQQRREGAGGKMLTYVPWSYPARRLLETMGTYSFKTREIERMSLPPLPPRHVTESDGRGGYRRLCKELPGVHPETTFRVCDKGCKPRERTEVIARCTIIAPWGAEMDCVGSREYYPNNPESSFADVEKAALSEALKTGAAKWGIALDLYDKEPPPGTAATSELDDVKAALRAAIKKEGMTPATAAAFFSRDLTGSPLTLSSLEECLDATGEEGEAAYWDLIGRLPHDG